MNNIFENYQLNSILDIYGGNKQNIDTATQYYIMHNNIPNGIVLSDKVVPVNNMHSISNTYYYYEDNDYDIKNMDYPDPRPYSKYCPLLISYENSYYIKDKYKLISAKDIDYENAYLKYANQTHNYNEPISYYTLSKNNDIISVEENTTYDYIFGREITPYINHTYDLLNIIDFLFNRVNCLNFLLDVIKKQKNIT